MEEENKLEGMVEKAQPTAPQRRWGCKMVLLGTVLAATAAYHAAFYVLGQVYERNKEEKASLKAGIEALIKGDYAKAQESFSPELLLKLRDEMNTPEGRTYDLSDPMTLYVESVDSGTQIEYFTIKRIDRATGEVTEQIGLFILEKQHDGTWKRTQE